jgi:peptidoglycan/LPS O-acetylase OafA/YrhL
VPAYVITVVAVWTFLKIFQPPWAAEPAPFPLWSYLTFTQTFQMVASNSIGVHALAPTWTLAVEEHFYMVAPLAIVMTPRRWLPTALGLVIAGALGLRIAVQYFGFTTTMTSLVMLPWRADILAVGILGAWAVTEKDFPWAKVDLWLRVIPIVALVATFTIKLADQRLFDVLSPLLVAAGGVSFLLSIVRGAPEARRFESKTLRFFGNNSYCLYLVHLPLLGLAHGLLLKAAPDLQTPVQWVVTLASLPVCVLAGWGMTKLVEEPLMAYGRRWRWSAERRGGGAIAAASIAP